MKYRYFLFVKEKEYPKFRAEFDRVKARKESGKTPVFCEVRCANTNLIESVPYNIINGAFIIFSSILLSKLNVNPILSIGVVLVINNFFGALSNWIFTRIKHRLRIRFLKKLGITPAEANIAVLESMEYQSV